MARARLAGIVAMALFLVGGLQGWVADAAEDQATDDTTAAPIQDIQQPGPTPLADDPPNLDNIRSKQIELVDATCDTVEATAEFVAREPSLAFLAESAADQVTKCDIAKKAVSEVTTVEIQAAAIKRGPTATVYAEYTGPNRDSGTGDAPVWAPGMPSLAGVEFLGSGYAWDGDGDGICATKGGGQAAAAVSAAASDPKDHGKKLTGYSEWCAEVIGDGVGDDDGFCEVQNPPGKDKKFEEACVTVTPTIETVEDNPENLETSTLIEYEGLLDNAISDSEAARAASAGLMASYQATTAMAASSGEGCPEPQARVVGSETSLHIIYAASDVAELVMNQANFWADQTFVVFGNGGNVKGAFSWTALIYSIAKTTASQFEVIADADTATNVFNTLTCLDQLRNDSADRFEQLGQDVAALARLSLQVLELKEKATYLVSATIAGVPASEVEFTSVKVSERSPVAFEDLGDAWDVVEVPGAPGTYELTVRLPSHLRNADLFAITAIHVVDDKETHGHVMIDRSLIGGTGQ